MADPNSPDGPKGIYVLPPADTGGIKRKHLDVPYANVSVFQKLDIYLPECGTAPHPVIVFVHGGAWMMCDKNDEQLSPVLKALDAGFAVVSVNYRLSGEAKFPAQIHDVKAAIRWLRAHAAVHGIDPDRLAVWGASAGGHLSELAGTSSGIEPLEDLSLGNPEFSSAADAVVAWYAPTDFLMMDVYLRETGAGTADHGDVDSPESRLLGRHIVEAPDLVRAANPETYIDAMAPPFLLQHGTADPIVPYQHSVAFAENIRKSRGSPGVVLDLIPGAEHGGSPEFETAENVARVIEFIRDALDAALARKHRSAVLFESDPAVSGAGERPGAARLLADLRRRGIRTGLLSAGLPGATAADCLAVVNSASGARAAKEAGMLAVGIAPSGRLPSADLTITGLDRLVADRFFRQSARPRAEPPA